MQSWPYWMVDFVGKNVLVQCGHFKLNFMEGQHISGRDPFTVKTHNAQFHLKCSYIIIKEKWTLLAASLSVIWLWGVLLSGWYIARFELLQLSLSIGVRVFWLSSCCSIKRPGRGSLMSWSRFSVSPIVAFLPAFRCNNSYLPSGNCVLVSKLDVGF